MATDSKKARKAAAALPTSIVKALRVGEDFELSKVSPHSTPGFAGNKALGVSLLAASADEVSDLQERLFADGTRSLLLLIQGMDTSGKGGIMRHVVGLLDPQGVALSAFTEPTAEEQRHPFLWRIRNALPRPGQVGVFDRSQYEDVLVVRVNDLVPSSTWKRRFGQIRTFETTLAQSGTRVVKVMLHISKDEQRKRLAQRLDRPDKHWKYHPSDVDERSTWEAYQQAYQEAIVKTSTDEAPWFVVPADRKWFARLAVQQILLHSLKEMDLRWPTVDFDVEVEKKRLAAS